VNAVLITGRTPVEMKSVILVIAVPIAGRTPSEIRADTPLIAGRTLPDIKDITLEVEVDIKLVMLEIALDMALFNELSTLDNTDLMLEVTSDMASLNASSTLERVDLMAETIQLDTLLSILENQLLSCPNGSYMLAVALEMSSRFMIWVI
jgi:hypothetical protein